MGGLYFTLALLSAIGTYCAIIKARRLYWAAPLYFLAAWLSGELAIIHLVWQVGLTVLLAFSGVLDSGLAQAGLGLFGLSWLGLVYLHVQAMDTQRILRRALRRGLGEDYRSSLPVERQRVLEDGVRASSWLKPFSMLRDGVRLHSHIAYADSGKRNLLDIYQPLQERDGGYPVLLQVHGGAWEGQNEDRVRKKKD